ncbi:hypothetical protein B0H17DRAFT_1132258 [Mycena rosella]|uniref:F-box domain-containing protein n=1 Tax=Mycena rosella TaxID=1033263 RepID=A0AAD7DKJ8_MYCRO|nr:hypothetical protein B0H17DRAFT_1132258 [Mycena rosella]
MSNADLRAQATDLISAISRQQHILDSLQTQLQNVQRQLDAIVYPVLILPPEITSEIFVQCLPDRRQWDVVNPDEAPLLLMHVCSAWRNIAVSTPALWSTLEISATDIAPYFLEIVQIWLQRSGQRPLSVRISGYVSQIERFVEFLKTFGQHSGRMRTLDLAMPEESFKAMDGQRLALSLLHTLKIDSFVTEDPPNPVTIFHDVDVPALREVFMTESPPSFIALPWKQLTKFTGEGIAAADCRKVLRLMPNLVDCSFAVFKDFEDGISAVSHPNIESFTLFKYFSDETGTLTDSTAVLASLTLPNLQTLKLLYSDPDDFDSDVFDAFLFRSGSRLQKLGISSVHHIGVASLRRVPSLVDLEIDHPHTSFIRNLFPSFGCDTTLLPRLRTLSFLGCVQGGASVSDIVRMAAAPMTDQMNAPDGFVPLQSFRLISNVQSPVPLCPDHELLPFKELKAAGMDIYIGTDTESFI